MSGDRGLVGGVFAKMMGNNTIRSKEGYLHINGSSTNGEKGGQRVRRERTQLRTHTRKQQGTRIWGGTHGKEGKKPGNARR
eukprot:NODE_3460_length_665_cov_172.930195_g2465_i0.p2 GENE.NODE_3460_length_665_cov_172.930195_g2465_i0~~NODE_3460_length_665_cov_172.930195_g2465_i0.p2  ORF type:complete len:93 (-),score=2.70 NODE_3460_length_665_cov_172.930195_g2465_i0:385-627(-)